MIYNIAGICVSIETDDAKIARYIDREYSLLIRETCDKFPDIRIVLSQKKVAYMNYSISIKSFMRAVNIAFNKDAFFVQYPKDLCNGILYSVINPAFQNRAESSLVDFFHNLFLGILQIWFLRNNATLFHACAYVDDKGKTHVLFGSAQSGKSTMINYLTRGSGSIISEDFCVVDQCGNLYALPHQGRISAKNHDLLSSHKPSLADRINRGLYSLIGKKVYRRLPFDQIFTNRKITTKANVGAIHILKRDSDHLYCEPCTSKEFTQFCYGVLENELRNFAGFHDFFNAMPENKYLGYSEKGVYDATRQVLERLSEIYTCDIIHLPMLDDPQEAAKALKEYLENG